MNNIRKLILITAASLFTLPAMATSLFIDVAHEMDMGATHLGNTSNVIGAADMSRDLPLAPSPNSFLTATYDALTMALDINGTALTYDNGTTSTDIFDAFSLSAIVDNAGNLLSGTFSIGGLLAGNLLDLFSSVANDGTLEILFDVGAGSLAADFGGLGALGGMIMTQIDFAGDWSNDWSGSFGVVGVASVLPVSEPGILILGGLGLAMIAFARRRRT